MERLAAINPFSALSLDAPEEELLTHATPSSNPGSKAGDMKRMMKKKKKGQRWGSSQSMAVLAGPSPHAEANASDRSEASKTNLRLPLVWIDLEMTGLDLEKDRILEIACIITDGRLSKMIEGPDVIINQPEELLASMGEWCQAHHTASGLVEGVRKSQVTEKEAEKQVLDFVRQHTGPMQPLLAGNSVYMDFMFIQRYMPNLAALFSHIIVDVSSIRALCFRWFPKDAAKAPVKKKQHRALEDIRESIVELKYMQKTIFKDNGN